MGLGKTLTMLAVIASSKKTAEIYGEDYFQDQRRLIPARGTLVVVTSRRRFRGVSSFVQNTDIQASGRGSGGVED